MARPHGIALATISDDPAARARSIRPAHHWSRAEALDWMRGQASRRCDILIGLDLSTAFPFIDAGGYFPGWAHSPADARALWRLVETICADDPDLGARSFLTDNAAGRYFRQRGSCGDRFGGSGTGRLRVVETHQRATGQANSASCFNLVGAAQVGKSSLTGMRVLDRLAGIIPIWPFDPLPADGPVIVEIYTSMAARAAGVPRGRSKIRDRAALVDALARLDARPPARMAAYDDHATDALITAAWLRAVHDRADLWAPPAMTPHVARTEGWTFGVV